jgi:hypothetical protein
MGTWADCLRLWISLMSNADAVSMLSDPEGQRANFGKKGPTRTHLLVREVTGSKTQQRAIQPACPLYFANWLTVGVSIRSRFVVLRFGRVRFIAGRR